MKKHPHSAIEAVLMFLFMSCQGYIIKVFILNYHLHLPIQTNDSNTNFCIFFVFAGFLWSIYGWQTKSSQSSVSWQRKL